MFELDKVKGIIFDYGGTIDSNGKHWAEVLWDNYQKGQVPITKEQFREAYVHVERHLATHPVISPEDNFNDLLIKKVKLQLDYLYSGNYLTDKTKYSEYLLAISTQCYNFTRDLIAREKPLLKLLHERYPMILVSNFYGNIHAVLNDFGLLEYFDNIIESAVVGIRKPDPAIFALGVDELNLPADQIVVIGDSHSKDIVPATKNGCQTIWLKGLGWGDDDENAMADIIITDFMELKDVFELGI